MVIPILFLTGCSWLDKDAGEKDPGKTISGRPMDKAPDIFSDEFKKKDVYDKPVTFSGTATRTEYFCLNGKCDECDTTGPLTITLLPDGSANLSHVAGCMVFYNGCLTQGNNCAYNITGSYSKTNDNIAFGKCNDGSIKGSGSSKINNDTTTGSAKCDGDKNPMMTMMWTDLPKVK